MRARVSRTSVLLVCINYANAVMDQSASEQQQTMLYPREGTQHLGQSGSRNGQRGPPVVLEGEQDAKREAMKSLHLEKLSPKQAEIIVEASETHQKGQKFEEILMKSQKTNQSQKIKGLTKANA